MIGALVKSARLWAVLGIVYRAMATIQSSDSIKMITVPTIKSEAVPELDAALWPSLRGAQYASLGFKRQVAMV